MKNFFLKAIILLIMQNSLSAQDYGSFIDSRDGTVYKTVKIGNQVWMTENLNTSSFSNGENIIHAETDSLWRKVSVSENKPAWCFGQTFPKKAGITYGSYGKLYNWYAVNDPRGLAPRGWHIPNDEEWSELIKYLGEENAVPKMKSTNNWTLKFNGTNESGFSAMPSGYKYWFDLGFFGEEGPICFFWSSTILTTKNGNSSSYANFISLYDKRKVIRQYMQKEFGFSVRCIKD